MKLLVFDVDDTLIAADKVFRQSTIDSLNERLALGDAIAIASGRPYIGIMVSINQVFLQAPVHIGDVVISNVCGTGVNVVATRNMEKIS